MSLWDDYDDVTFEVVRNDEGQYSIWPTTRPRPGGWEPVAGPATRADCLADIDTQWTDMRPRSVSSGGTAPVDREGDREWFADPASGQSVLVGPAPWRVDTPIHVLIEQAAVPGERVAMRCGAQELSRAEMFDTCHAWASVLSGEGCAAETPVGLLIPRGVDALVAILSVLHTGAAYVPLSVDDPPERLRSVLEDCGQPLVVADAELVPRLAGYAGRVLPLEELRTRAAGVRGTSTPVHSPVPMDRLAFIMYTSGTTGRPKGVEGTHRQLTNYALWCRDAFPHELAESTVLHAPLSFLGSLTNIFTPLLAGWPIEVVPDGTTVDELLKLLEQRTVGLLKLTPTHVRMMLALGAAQRRTARQFMIGSEPLIMSEELAAWVRGEPDATYVNHYGLTETHGCFCHPFTADVPSAASVPIGRPIANVRAYLVDRHGVEVPVGETGELVVAGHSIGRGYHGRPALTAERWIPDWRGAPGTRALRTGDLGRVRPDGTVELLGRADRQIKVRGHRVEPGAVEYHLRALAGIADALVLPRHDDGVTSLAAFLVPVPGADIDPATVHRALSARLAPPAVPSRMAILDQFPTNANGKLDVSALPVPQPISLSAAASQPEYGRWTRYDLAVADAYCQALGVQTVGLDDDLFALGGDSLMAVGIAIAVGTRFGCEGVPVPTVDHGTVAGYAKVVEAALLAERGEAPV